MPTPQGGNAQAFEKKLAAYGFQPAGFEKISTTKARATGLAVKDQDFLNELEKEREPRENGFNEKIEPKGLDDGPTRSSPRYRRYIMLVLLVGIVGGGAAAGAFLGSEDSSSALAASPTALPTSSPTLRPTRRRFTRRPTRNPTSSSPTPAADLTSAPSSAPTESPTFSPTRSPTKRPVATLAPTRLPTGRPTSQPTSRPTRQPTRPTSAPSFAPLSRTELKDVLTSKIRATFGWRDACRDCRGEATKFGTFVDTNCITRGSDSGCINANGIRYAGIDIDGTGDEHDRFYLRINALDLNCGLSTSAACARGTPRQKAIFDLRYLCLGFGWRDDCNSCTQGPSKLQEYCVDSSLSQSVLGENTRRGSLNLGGRVNGDDNFYVTAYVHPFAPRDSEMLSYVRTYCRITIGWRDECESCTDAPTKRGSVFFSGTCTGVTGSDSRCVGRYALISPDGRVDGNDKFYMALTCTV